MAIIAAGTPVPELTLKREDGSDFTQDDLRGRTTVLVFYPFAFSPVCTDQLQVYEELLPELEQQNAVMYGVSTDASWSQTAFKEKLGITIEQLSDFEPKGAASKALGAYFDPAGMTNRALIVVGADGTVAWSHLAASPGELPGVDKVREGLAAAAA
ncbi:redoxin domain-containing protein [Patulibacter defluvii]|uniref:redoxin domain-containing protein n=1 Tax=Patulibacter defluvii TaxID=3095358 RepID=UPI002A7616AC|nr:redoxin domain-containing protein [Patulibacter sp. DM4]